MSAVGYHIVVKPLKRKYGEIEYSRTAEIIRYGTLFTVAGFIITTLVNTHFFVFALVGAVFGNYVYQNNRKDKEQ